MKRRVAITGLGMVTPVGNDVRSTWESLKAGRSGAAKIKGWDASGFPVQIGAEVKDFQADVQCSDPKLLKFASRSHRFALAAAEEAFKDAGIRPERETTERWGFTVGAGMMAITFGELEAVHEFCAPEGDFNPEGLLDARFPADPIGF